MLDIECIKPGNVNLVSGHDDTNAKDFISSYKATSKIITLPDISLGERIESCIVETKKITTKNTNLGIILLCSLFSQSLLLKSKKLDESIHDTVMSSSNDDVTRLCNAITLANPGGLGSHDEYDVNSNPKVTLYDLMKASAEYDQISNQYYLKFFRSKHPWQIKFYRICYRHIFYCLILLIHRHQRQTQSLHTNHKNANNKTMDLLDDFL